MAWRKMRLGTALSLGGIVAAAPLIAACGGPSYEDWAATDGAAGRINLDDVQEAFKNSDSATEFEQRVNEIYEGDGLVLIRAKQDGEQLTLEGWEDLNNDNTINEADDDQLFSIVRGTNGDHEMRGHHANGYYNSHFGAGDFLFTYLLISAITPRFGGYYYTTPPSQGPQMRNQRTTYRNSSAYGGQVQRNASYNTKQASFAGSRYQSSREQRQLKPRLVPVHPAYQRVLPYQQQHIPHQLRAVIVAQLWRLRRRRRNAATPEVAAIEPRGESFVLRVFLAGMDPDDHLSVELPSDFLAGSVAQLLDRVLPVRVMKAARRSRTCLTCGANPDLPDIYAVLLAVCGEWRDWRCALVVSTGRDAVELDTPVAEILQPTEGIPVLQLRLEQEYRALEYAVRQGLWASREDLLRWMRSLVTLYFLDKHEAILASPPPLSNGPALVQATQDLESQGIIAVRAPRSKRGASMRPDPGRKQRFRNHPRGQAVHRPAACRDGVLYRSVRSLPGHAGRSRRRTGGVWHGPGRRPSG